LVGLAVFSHWVLDLIVHVPDLALYDDAFKMGFGLWNYPEVELPLEFFLLIGGLWLYLRSTKPKNNIGRYGMIGFVAFLIALHIFTFLGPPPESPLQMAAMGLGSYVILAAIALWLDRYRE